MKDAEAVSDSDYKTAVNTLAEAKAAFQKEGGNSGTGISLISSFNTNIGDYKVQSTLRNDIQKIDAMTQLSYYSAEAKKSPISDTDTENGFLWLRENTNGKDLFPHLRGCTEIKTDSDGIIATGNKLSFTRDSVKYDFTVIVKGDVSCDGKVNAVDYLMLQRAILGNYSLRELPYMAGCITDKNSIKNQDYIKLKRHVLGTFDLFA